MAAMQNDIRLEYRQAIDESHSGHQVVVETIHTGAHGCPQIHIDREFLAWAFTHRSISSIACFLGVSRCTVQTALAEYGIVSHSLSSASLQPFDAHEPAAAGDADELLDLNIPVPNVPSQPPVSAVSAALSTISDNDLDTAIIDLRRHFHRAGLSMLHGMLQNLGHCVPREHIRAALLRVNPVHRVFDRIQICWREYSVPGPNSLWHHDSQHGMQIVDFNGGTY